MKNRKKRIDIIIDIIRDNCIGSQEELAKMLEEQGHHVTQATLSRFKNAPDNESAYRQRDLYVCASRE